MYSFLAAFFLLVNAAGFVFHVVTLEAVFFCSAAGYIFMRKLYA